MTYIGWECGGAFTPSVYTSAIRVMAYEQTDRAVDTEGQFVVFAPWVEFENLADALSVHNQQ